MFQLQINDIPIERISRDKKVYKIVISDERLEINVFIPARKYNFSKTGRVSAPRFTLRKQKKQRFISP